MFKTFLLVGCSLTALIAGSVPGPQINNNLVRDVPSSDVRPPVQILYRRGTNDNISQNHVISSEFLYIPEEDQVFNSKDELRATIDRYTMILGFKKDHQLEKRKDHEEATIALRDGDKRKIYELTGIPPAHNYLTQEEIDEYYNGIESRMSKLINDISHDLNILKNKE